MFWSSILLEVTNFILASLLSRTHNPYDFQYSKNGLSWKRLFFTDEHIVLHKYYRVLSALPN